MLSVTLQIASVVPDDGQPVQVVDQAIKPSILTEGWAKLAEQSTSRPRRPVYKGPTEALDLDGSLTYGAQARHQDASFKPETIQSPRTFLKKLHEFLHRGEGGQNILCCPLSCRHQITGLAAKPMAHHGSRTYQHARPCSDRKASPSSTIRWLSAKIQMRPAHVMAYVQRAVSVARLNTSKPTF